jgi:hypothetical protein
MSKICQNILSKFCHKKVDKIGTIAQLTFFATMSKKGQPNAKKNPKNVTKCHEKSTGEFSAFLDQMRLSRMW